MRVKLISVTNSVIFNSGNVMNAEQLLVYIARVSSPANQTNMDTADKLLRYLIRNKHWSPFDMVNLCVEVQTSKAIAIQILRHWSIKPQEFSQRYAEVTEVEPIELRRQAETNRQGGEEVFDPVITLGNTTGLASTAIDSYIELGKRLYKLLLEAKVAKECARMILPMASTTTLYLNGSIRSWIHYLEQRTDKHAQKEHRLVAAEVRRIFAEQFPNVIKAIEDGSQSKEESH